MNGNHMKYMLFGGIGLLAVALALGIQLQTALLVAFVLACPLMMMAMMGMANSDGAHAGHGAMGHASRATNATTKAAPTTSAHSTARMRLRQIRPSSPARRSPISNQVTAATAVPRLRGDSRTVT